MVALVGPDLVDHSMHAGVAFKRGGVQMKLVENVLDARQPMLGVFERDSPHQSVNFVSLREQEFGEIRSILTGNAGN